jgi:hypothetical protein
MRRAELEYGWAISVESFEINGQPVKAGRSVVSRGKTKLQERAAELGAAWRMYFNEDEGMAQGEELYGEGKKKR